MMRQQRAGRPVRESMAIWRMLSVFFLLCGGLAVGSVPAWAEEEIAGRAIAINGDTLRITRIDGKGHAVIRLYGVDAPETNQHCETEYGRLVSCGRQAMDALGAMLRHKQVTCVNLEQDSENNMTGLCYAGDIILNGAIVRAGWALAYVNESQDYLGLERRAKRSGKGIWELRFEKPWIWRAAQAKLKKRK